MKKYNNPYHDESMWRGASSDLFKNVQDLRQRETKVEQLLWEYLRNKKMRGFKFRRQHPIQHYIVDFYCHEADLVIELDGEYHNEEEQKLKDIDRENEIVFQGMTVLRFTNQEILDDIQEVLDTIEAELIGYRLD